jgi:hypothetical protein
MNKRVKGKTRGAARPIKTRRDYQGASAVVKRLSTQSDRTSTDEARLQSLLQEMDKFDGAEDDADTDLTDGDGYSGPRRRWSDEME